MSVMALLLINNVVDAFEYMRFTRVLVQKHVTMHVLGSRTQTFRTSVLEIELMFTITLLLNTVVTTVSLGASNRLVRLELVLSRRFLVLFVRDQ